ncbi:MAG: alkane 1-monooxygenase [Flavobacteriaceae bacterium]
MMFRDLKYLLAYTIPLATVLAIYYKGFFSYATVVYAFVCIPIVEILVAERQADYTPEEVSNRRLNALFDWMLYGNIPVTFGLLTWGLWDLHAASYDTYEIVGKVFSLGVLLGTNGINVAHELGHRSSLAERSLAKMLLCPSLYMHFYIEHNFGHHKNVSTPEDPATARRKQSVYHFWFHSIVGQYRNSWKLQTQLLKNKGEHFFSWHNDMLFYVLFQSLYLLVVYFTLGTMGVLFAVFIAVVSFLLLETINYIEHYGLERKKLASGRYERVQAHHSWNSNHIVGRMVLYELTRHSDHHYRANKKYQILENKPSSPQLPYGYPSSMVLSMIPPLWFRKMDGILDQYQQQDN